jgi:hypothetical protein
LLQVQNPLGPFPRLGLELFSPSPYKYRHFGMQMAQALAKTALEYCISSATNALVIEMLNIFRVRPYRVGGIAGISSPVAPGSSAKTGPAHHCYEHGKDNQTIIVWIFSSIFRTLPYFFQIARK